MGMNFAQFRKVRERKNVSTPILDNRMPSFTQQEERFLYSLHLKTIELRTLMTTLRVNIPREQLDEVLVEYAIRLRKAKTNFQRQHFKNEYYLEVEQIDISN